IARRQRTQPERHAQGMASMVAGGQAQSHGPIYVHQLAALEKGLAVAGVRLARPGNAADGGNGDRSKTMSGEADYGVLGARPLVALLFCLWRPRIDSGQGRRRLGRVE